MTLKKSWDGSYGVAPLFTSGECRCKMLEFDMLKLKAEDKYTCGEQGREFCVIIIGGICSIYGEGFSYKNIGRRKNAFDGAATAVYIPAGTEFTVAALTEMSAAICKAPSDVKKKPLLIKPEDVKIKELGKPGWQRQAHFILDERFDADKLYIGEAFVDGGQWASYPPHKHDVENMPVEGFAEEIYYFEYDKPQGFGIQKIYTGDGSLDETYTVKNGDAVEIPYGYHPCMSAPGYKNYYLWIMSCNHRGFFMSSDPEHAWLNA